MWPDDEDLPVEVFAAFGANPGGNQGDWVWTDLTGRLESNPIPIRRGANSAGGTTSPGSATIHLSNDDGALTPLRPQSIYYPNVVKGTPVWVALRRVEDTFARTVSGGWGTAESGQTWDRLGGSAAEFSVSGGVGRHLHDPIALNRRTFLNNSMLDCHQVVDVSTSALVTGAALVTGVIARYVESAIDYYWCRTEFGAGSTSITLKIVRVRDGVHTELAVLSPVPGLTYAANTPLRTRVSIAGATISMKTWTASNPEPAGWQLETVDPDPLTAPGATGIQSWVIAGNTNSPVLTASFDNYLVRADLMCGFADSWQPQFIPGTDGVSSVVRVTVSGILRRLGQGSVPRSPATGYLASTGPVFYHPLEDGADASVAASGILGGAAMTVRNGVMDFVDDAPPGASGSAKPLPTAANMMVGLIDGASSNGFQVGVWTKGEVADDTAGSAYYIPWEVRTSTGQIFRMAMQWEEDRAIGVSHFTGEAATSPSNTVWLDDSGSPHLNPGITGEWIHVQFMARPAGANIDVFLWVNGTLVSSGTWNSITLGAPIRVNAIGAFAGVIGQVSLNVRDIWLSQLVLHDFSTHQVTQYEAGLGFPGEATTTRLERVAEERGVSLFVHPGDTEALGTQPYGGLLDVFRDAEQADMGILYERGWGLAYRPRVTRYNQTPALVVDLAPPAMFSAETRPESVVAPTYDDQQTRNDVTVSRRDGASARVVDEEHADRHGTYDDSVELGIATDAQVPHHAGWRVHLGTWEEMRYPAIPVDLAGDPTLIDGWLNLLPGDRVQQVNVPAPHPPEDVDQLADGTSQTLTRRGWTGQVVGTPARPWQVGVVEDTTYGRADTDGSMWNADFAAGTDTSALVVVTAGPPWITTANQAAMLPFNIRSGGSVLEVTGIAAAVNDTFNRTGAGGWGTATTGQAWTVSQGVAANFSVVSNTSARIALATINQLEVGTLDAGTIHADPIYQFVLTPIPTGAGFSFWCFTRYTDSSNHYYATLLINTTGVVELRLFKRVAGSATQLGSTFTLGAIHTTSGNWVLQCSAIGSTVRARAWKVGQPAERGWHITATDTTLTSGTRVGIGARRETGNTNGSTNVEMDYFTVPALHTFTLTAAPVNGVERTIPAGTSLSLADPWRAAL